MFKKFLYWLVYLIDSYQQRKTDKKDKLIKTYNISGKLKSDVGSIEALQIHLTKPFVIYELITDNNKLYCADEHIVFLENGEEIWVKYLKKDMFIKSTNGLDKVLSVKQIGNNSYMYDVSVDNPNRYYTNNILSHNTICSSIFMLWYITFEIDKNIMIVANKGDTVNEIVNKVKDIYKHLPFFIKPGISIQNERSVRVDTDCRILGAARSKEPAIGFTIDVLYMDEFAHIPKNIIEPYYENALPTVSSLTHSKVIITSTPNGQNLFYNLITDAETTDVTRKNEYTPMRVYWHQVPGRDTIWIIPNIEALKVKKIELSELKDFLENEGFVFIKEQKISKGIRLHYKHHKQNYDNIVEISSLRFRDEFITEYCTVSSWKNSEINTFGGGQKGLEKFGQQYDLLFNVGSKMLFGGHIMSSLNTSCRPFEYIDIPEITDNIAFEINELKWITAKRDQEVYFNVNRAKDYHIVISIDLAEGLGKDYLVANIFRLMPMNIDDLGKNNIFSNIDEFFSLYQIGIYYNNLISVEEFAEFIYLLVFEFFDSEKVKIVVESNGYGDEFIKSMQYAQGGVNNFGSHVFVKYKHSHNANVSKPGIRLNNINRAMLIKTFQGLVERHKIKIFEKSTIEELATFTKQESRAGNVKYEAEIGHDDITMSMVNLSSIFDTTEQKNMCELYYDILDVEYKEMVNSRLKNVYVETIDYELTSMKNKKIITDQKLSKMEEQMDLLDMVKTRKREYSDDDDGVSTKDILYGSGFDNRL